MQGLFDDENENTKLDPEPGERDAGDEPVIMSSYTPPSAGETFRRTGLAWSAGVAFSGAIIVMSFLGWLADLVFGSSPWGIVGGIILGSIIGFLQFFRITKLIFPPDRSLPAEHPLMAPADSRDKRRDEIDEPR